MPSMRPVAIVLPNLLERLGVQEIFGRYFSPLGVGVFERTEEIVSAEDYSCFVTDAASYIAESEFFLPRRSRCAVIVRGANNPGHGGSPLIVPGDSSLEEMIDSLGSFVEKIEQTERQDSQTVPSQELSAREIDVLKLVVSGDINKDIADKLHISMNTVLTHRKNITAKLGIKTISGLTLYALMNGYLSPE